LDRSFITVEYEVVSGKQRKKLLNQPIKTVNVVDDLM